MLQLEKESIKALTFQTSSTQVLNRCTCSEVSGAFKKNWGVLWHSCYTHIFSFCQIFPNAFLWKTGRFHFIRPLKTPSNYQSQRVKSILGSLWTARNLCHNRKPRRDYFKGPRANTDNRHWVGCCCDLSLNYIKEKDPNFSHYLLTLKRIESELRFQGP